MPDFDARLRSLTLAPLDLPPDLDLPRTRDVSGGPAAMVNAGAVVAFGAGVAPQDQEDVLYSLQFAQRAASGVANRFAEVQAWYREYVRTLELLGWVVRGFAPARQVATEDQVQMAKAALDILATAAAGPASAVLAAAVTALEGMAEDDGFITLFERIATDGQVANFQLGGVNAEPSGQISMQIGAFEFKARERKRKFLFVKWNSRAIDIFADTQTALFNRDHYAVHARDTVRQMLGADARKALGQIRLGRIG